MHDRYYDFSEEELHGRLTLLSPKQMLGFAASCAERLMPVYDRYTDKAKLSTEESNIYREALDAVWN